MTVPSVGSATEIGALCAAAHWCSARGWVPATSGNFSLRNSATGHIHISRSGLDKGQMQPEDLLEIDAEGNILNGAGKSSAETGLHLAIYRDRPEANAILHVHTVWNTLLSARMVHVGRVSITGYELLKALDGVESHLHREYVPILHNSQEYAELSSQLVDLLRQNPQMHGVLLSAHGFYTWGRSVAEARRHLEALEFLFEVEGRRLFGAIG